MRRKRQKEPENHERWLVSYADFITLLFAFFVVMYAISQADLEKLKKASESIQDAFGKTQNTLDQVSDGKVQEKIEPKGQGQFTESQSKVDKTQSLDDVKKRVEEALLVGYSSPSQLVKREIKGSEQMLRIVIPKAFDHGAERGIEDALPVFERIGRAFLDTPFHMEIQGYCEADEGKESGGSFRLSANRAAWFAEFLLTRFNVDPQNVTIRGFGHYRPLSESSGDGMDRRLEIVVLE